MKTYHFEGHFALVDLRRRSRLQNVDRLAEIDAILERLVESFRFGLGSGRERFSDYFRQPSSCLFIQLSIVLGGFLNYIYFKIIVLHKIRQRGKLILPCQPIQLSFRIPWVVPPLLKKLVYEI